jgi:hypothetical protein
MPDTRRITRQHRQEEEQSVSARQTTSSPVQMPNPKPIPITVIFYLAFHQCNHAPAICPPASHSHSCVDRVLGSCALGRISTSGEPTFPNATWQILEIPTRSRGSLFHQCGLNRSVHPLQLMMDSMCRPPMAIQQFPAEVDADPAAGDEVQTEVINHLLVSRISRVSCRMRRVVRPGKSSPIQASLYHGPHHLDW